MSKIKLRPFLHDLLHLTMSSYKRSYGSKKRTYGGVSKAAKKKQKNLTSADVKRLAKQMIARSVEEKHVAINVHYQYADIPSNAPPFNTSTVGTYSGYTTSMSPTFPVLNAGSMNDQREGDSVMLTGLKLQCSLAFAAAKVTNVVFPYIGPAVRVVVVRYKGVLPDLTTSVACNNSIYGWADSAAVSDMDVNSYWAPHNSNDAREVVVLYDRRFVGGTLEVDNSAFNDDWSLSSKRIEFEIDLTSKVKGKKLLYNDPTIGTALKCAGQFAIYVIADDKVAIPEALPHVHFRARGKLSFKELD